MNTKETIPPIWNVNNAKEFFSSSLKGTFSPHVGKQSRHSPGDIVSVLRNSITLNEYVKTYVRNNPSGHVHPLILYSGGSVALHPNLDRTGGRDQGT